jgi:hypothetical protein
MGMGPRPGSGEWSGVAALILPEWPMSVPPAGRGEVLLQGAGSHPASGSGPSGSLSATENGRVRNRASQVQRGFATPSRWSGHGPLHLLPFHPPISYFCRSAISHAHRRARSAPAVSCVTVPTSN